MIIVLYNTMTNTHCLPLLAKIRENNLQMPHIAQNIIMFPNKRMIIHLCKQTGRQRQRAHKKAPCDVTEGTKVDQRSSNDSFCASVWFNKGVGASRK